MKGVLKRVSAGSAGRILDSANPKETTAEQKAVPLQRRREKTQRV